MVLASLPTSNDGVHWRKFLLSTQLQPLWCATKQVLKGQRQRKHMISVTRLLTAAHGGMKETARVSGEQKRS